MSARRRVCLALGCACLAGAIVLALRARATDAPRRGALLERLLGPAAPLLAGVQWVRVDLALRRSDWALAYERAENALRLAPSDPQGWIFYAHNLIFQRASPLREPSPQVRAAWAAAGFAILRRAEEQCSDPAEVLVYEAEILRLWAGLPEADRPWPGDTRAALERAREALRRARELGHPQAAELERALDAAPAPPGR